MITIELGTIDREDLPQLRTWRNDWRIWKWTRQNDLINEVHHAEWFERQAKDPTVRMYKLIMKAGGDTHTVGVAGLTSLDWQNRRAEFSFYIAPNWQRMGLAKMGLPVLFAHGFENLGLNVIWGETFDGNPAAGVFEKIGMVKEGTRRSFYWKDGRYIDAHLYSVTREEWDARHRDPDLVVNVDPVEPSGERGPSSEPAQAVAPDRCGAVQDRETGAILTAVDFDGPKVRRRKKTARSQ